ncbi:acetyltransferase (GNAT) family protein [Stella humosa]|uniref:Acetyltransferase (GNAT) family protein n=1 Tax=Stella humosa TaxID=94 RepID=A0A3N1KYB7_9PROT|nr:GNAT family N-acetyltransferase [Stella humosa]ROP84147.1 acetyltransferase (GNAT) family protein [Stella humosa]BBK33657.1 acetyltransferase [Stella humosa]
MASTDPRPLRPDDAAALTGLSAEAGWNQNAQDWRVILEHGGGEGIFDGAGRPLASACAVPLTARSQWICMVLVTPDARRRGYATHLMARQIAGIEAAGRVPGLDATELGRPVYERLGFRPLFSLSRYRAADPRWWPVDPGTELRPITLTDLDALAAYDAEATGSDRAFLLTHLAQRMPQAAWLAHQQGRIAGFALARDGLKATGIGPLVADTSAVAAALAAAAGRTLAGPVVIDVPDAATAFVARLADAGFIRERGFTRMVRGADAALDRTAALYALAGPEFG